MGDKTFSERLDLIREGSQWKRIDDGAIGTILEIRDDNSNNLVVRWTHPSFEGSRAGECDRYEFARKWVPLESHPDDIPVKVDSIWKSNKTGDIVKVLIEPDVSYPSVHYINLNDTTGKQMMSHVDKATFITEHTFIRDNDNGALYRHNRNPNTYLKVIETTKKPTIMGTIDYVKYRVIRGDSVEDGHECLIVTFHSCCHLLSLDPKKEYTVPTDSVKTIKAEDDEETKRLKSKYHKIAKELRDLAKERDITIGSIWRGVKGMEECNKGRLIKVVRINGSLISWRYLANAEGCPDIELNRHGTKTTCDSSFLYCFEKVQDNDDGAIYQPFDRVHDAKENPGKYQMVKVVETNVSTYPGDFVYGTIKYITIPISAIVYSMNLEEFHSEFELVSLNPAEEFCVDVNDPNYSRKLIDPNKGESKMEDNETYLKTDKNKLEDFGTGAKREDKSGKGRYDLIPGDIMADFVNYAWKEYFNEGPMTICDTDVSIATYFDDVTDEELFFEFILNMTCLFFTDHNGLEETTDCVGERSYVVTWEAFHEALYEMRELLAKHYEAGAKVHGVNNWKKGIPISDSERGGNFVDSMRRHADQALRGLDDEPHAISAIWNAFAAIWTLRNNTSIVNSSETKPEAEVKFKDREVKYLTLPSGRKIKIEFLKLRTNNEKDKSFLMALLHDQNAVDDIMKSLESGDDQN